VVICWLPVVSWAAGGEAGLTISLRDADYSKLGKSINTIRAMNLQSVPFYLYTKTDFLLESPVYSLARAATGPLEKRRNA